MKALMKRIYLIGLTALCSLCLLFGCVFAFTQTTRVKADAATLEAEFTNGGQFSVNMYNGAVPFEYVDGATEGLPEGYDGSVLKITTTSGLAYAVLDFSVSEIQASSVESIVVRMYSPGYTSADEFRTNVGSGGEYQVQYGAGAYNMGTWCDITLNETSMSTMTDANGYLANISVGTRVKSGAAVYYIDSVTVNMKASATSLETEFTNNGQFIVSYYTGNEIYAYQFVDGASESLPAGYNGAVLKINSQSTGGAPYVNLDFTASKISAASVESVVARVYSPDYTADDLLRINNVTNSMPAADLSTWCDVELPLATITGEDGNLGSFAFGLRDKGTTSDYFYIDSITVNMIKNVNITFSSIHGLWNNYAYDNAYCTFLQFTGGITGNGNLDADFSDLLSKMTIDGEAVDANNILFYCPNWIGASGGIIMRIATNPATGSVLHFPAGATFDIGGTDTNIYKIENDIDLQFNGETWSLYVPYGTPTFSATTNDYVGAWDWNHQTQNAAVVKDTNYGYTIIADWAITSDSTNLAATENLTSTSITLNGKSFYELYQADDGYRLNAQLGFFAFSVPTAALVAAEGYEYPTLEIVNGTPFYAGNYLPATKLIYKDNAWQLAVEEEKVNYTPDFVEIGALNHYDNGDMGFGLSLVYNTTGFTTDGIQVFASSYNGVTINGETQAVALWGKDQLLFWIERDKCEAGYNGYSHATLEIVVGAKIVNDSGEEFTLGGVTLYLVDGAWMTEKPADYEIFVLEPTTFVGLGADSTKNAIVVQFTDNTTWTEEIGNFAEYVLLDGATTLAADGGNVVIDALNKVLTLNVLGDYSKVEIVEGAEIAGVVLPAMWAYSTESGWALVPQKTNSLVGVGVYGNNNLPVANSYHTVLQFSEYFVIGNNAASDSTNMAAIECELSTKVKLNGKSFYELYQENSIFYIGYMAGGKYFTFQIPQTYLDGEPENGYKYHTLEIEEGTQFNDWLLPEISLVSFDKVWMSTADFDPTPLPYTGIPYGWNATSNGTTIDTILQFGEYGVDFLGTDNGSVSHADPSNLAKLESEQISTKLTINGVSVKEIDGVTVSYAHGYNFLYISIPNYELSPNEEYKCVTLHIEQNTVFKKSVLNEVTLYFFDGQWQEEKPDTVETDEDGTYLTANDIFNGTEGEYKLSTPEESVEILSTMQAGASTIYNFLYKSDSVDFDYSLFTNVGEDFDGVRVMVFRNAGESLQGFNVYVNGTLVGAQKVSFVEDEWYAIRIAMEMEDGNIKVSVAVDSIVVVKAETEYSGELGDQIKLQKSYGSVTFADFRRGDIKKPTINWQGKNVYRYTVGEEKPEDSAFLMVLSATDDYDKASLTDEDFVIVWQDGALVDGKLTAGEWTVRISISDTAGNVASILVQVLVFNPDEVAVSFNVNGEITYGLAAKGGLLEKPADPTKHGNESTSYVFDGWYVGNRKWDFANDYVLEDMELMAVFKAENREYTVTIESEGLEKDYTYVLKLHYGSTLDESIFAHGGYSYILTSNGKEIDKVTVNGDMQITVVYTPENNTPGDNTSNNSSESETSEPNTSEPETSDPDTSEKKSGCFGSINGVCAVVAMVIVASMALFVKNSRGGKENE